MNWVFPSVEFDDAVAAVCHGEAGDMQMRALNELLRVSPAARDEYLLRVELHARLASDPNLFGAASEAVVANVHPDRMGVGRQNKLSIPTHGWSRQKLKWSFALAAGFVLLVTAGFGVWFKHLPAKGATSRPVAVLSLAVDARWNSRADAQSIGAALEPGWLRLKSGLIQVTFYNGARLVMEGPAQVRLVSPGEAFCQSGRVMAEVPAQARGFRVGAPQVQVVDLGTQFGLEAKSTEAEVHVFKGEVEYTATTATKQRLQAGEAVVVANNGAVRSATANPAAFAALFDLRRQWLAMLATRYQDWRSASARLNQDPSLLVRFDFEDNAAFGWSLHNVAAAGDGLPDATIVGCEWTEGRWPGKHALEFRNVSDRVRFNVPGEFHALTAAAWVNVKGLDRQFNSLLMCDGFTPGTLHWQIQNSGALDLGVQGAHIRDVQILVSPPVISFNQLGQWLHLAVVVDGERRQVVHYVNGLAVSRHALTQPPPYLVGSAELGNWNPGEITKKMSPFMIRHFSGAMDEFVLFSRALNEQEIRKLYSEGNPQPDVQP